MKRYFSDETEPGGNQNHNGTNTEAWEKNLEEAIHQQTMKETGDYQNEQETGSFSVPEEDDAADIANDLSDDSSIADHLPGDSAEAPDDQSTDRFGYDGYDNEDSLGEQAEQPVFKRSRNFADPEDFAYQPASDRQPQREQSGSQSRRESSGRQPRQKSSGRQSRQESSGRQSLQESPDRQGQHENSGKRHQMDNSARVSRRDGHENVSQPKGAGDRTNRGDQKVNLDRENVGVNRGDKDAHAEDRHMSFTDKFEEKQRDHEEADEAARDADAVLFDEVVDDDGMTARQRKKAEKARARKEKKRGRDADAYSSRNDGAGRRQDTGRYDRDRYDRDDGYRDEYGRDDYDDRYNRYDDRRDYDDYYDDRYDDRRSRRSGRDTGSENRRMSRREQKEYEDFLDYKAEVAGKRKKKKKHRLLKFLIWLAVILVVLYCLGTIGLRVLGIQRSDLNMKDISNAINEQVKESAQSGAMAHYRNIALFGVDSIDQSLDSGNNRTDVMIIASINELTGDVKLVSLYRDTYLDIGDGNYQKANAAYAYGGPDQAVNMINTNLDLNVTDYVTVGFGGVADMIDAVGGIEIDVQQDEIEHLNNYQSTMATELGKEYIPVTQTGPQTLNGLQATAYCRIRYTDGGDFKRTERQKEVLSKTFAKLKSAGPATMIRAARSLSSEMRTSLSTGEITLLAMQAFRFNITDTSGFPQEDMRTVGYIGDQSCVIPIHLADNVVWLHQYLFSDTSYQASSTVQEISNQISANSGY